MLIDPNGLFDTEIVRGLSGDLPTTPEEVDREGHAAQDALGAIWNSAIEVGTLVARGVNFITFLGRTENRRRMDRNIVEGGRSLQYQYHDQEMGDVYEGINTVAGIAGAGVGVAGGLVRAGRRVAARLFGLGDELADASRALSKSGGLHEGLFPPHIANERTTRILSKINGVNPDRLDSNCGRVVAAVERRFRGQSSAVAGRADPTGMYIREIADQFRRGIFLRSGPRQIERHLRRPGSRGIVTFNWREPVNGIEGHALNVINDRGAIRYIDGQSGRVYNSLPDDISEIRFMRVDNLQMSE